MLLAEWSELEDPRRRRELTGGKRTALSIGVFDGLHRGHRALVEKIIQKAAGNPEKMIPAVLTFRTIPKKSAHPIISFEEKIALFDSFGIALCVIIDFSPDFGKISGRVFTDTLCRYLDPAYMAVGTDFHCGYRRDTNALSFKALGEERGIETEIVQPVLDGGRPVSSSRIRAALRGGDYDAAALLLGRPAGRYKQGFKE